MIKDIRVPHLPPVFQGVCQIQYHHHHRHQSSCDQRHQSSPPASSVSRCVPDTVSSSQTEILSSQTLEFLTCLLCFQLCARHSTIITDTKRCSPASRVSRCVPDTVPSLQTSEFLTCLQCFQVCTRHSTIITDIIVPVIKDTRVPHLSPVFQGVYQTQCHHHKHQSFSPASRCSRCVPDTVTSL